MNKINHKGTHLFFFSKRPHFLLGKDFCNFQRFLALPSKEQNVLSTLFQVQTQSFDWGEKELHFIWNHLESFESFSPSRYFQTFLD